MSIFTIDMSGRDADKIDLTASQYDEEVLCAGWIPGLDLQQDIEQHAKMPEDLLTASADIFLAKMYSFQR